MDVVNLLVEGLSGSMGMLKMHLAISVTPILNPPGSPCQSYRLAIGSSYLCRSEPAKFVCSGAIPVPRLTLPPSSPRTLLASTTPNPSRAKLRLYRCMKRSCRHDHLDQIPHPRRPRQARSREDGSLCPTVGRCWQCSPCTTACIWDRFRSFAGRWESR